MTTHRHATHSHTLRSMQLHRLRSIHTVSQSREAWVFMMEGPETSNPTIVQGTAPLAYYYTGAKTDKRCVESAGHPWTCPRPLPYTFTQGCCMVCDFGLRLH